MNFKPMAITALALSAVATSTAQKQRPNLIIIMTDQHRFDYMGDVNPNIKTPNINALSKDGVRFTNGYSSTPSSTPARAALLTGQSPWHHGMIGYHAQVAPKYPIELPQLLTDAGYYSYAIGKMHYYPQRALHGFAATELDESGRVESPDFISDYRTWFAQQAPGQNPDSTGIDWNGHAASTYALEERLHPTVWTADRAVKFIDEYNRDEPMFLKVSFARPHSPYDPPKRYLDMYNGVDIAPPYHSDWDSQFASYPKSDIAPYADYGNDYAVNSRRHYAANVTFIDDQIGRIVESLKEKGMYENSVIVFISDHGDMLGDYYHWRKTYPYEGSTHIPFIVRHPSDMKAKVRRGTTLPQPVEIRDILPTFLDAAQVSIPEGVDGSSILGLIRNPKSEWRKYIDMEHASCYRPNSGWVALTDGALKYVWNYGNGTEELFDIRTNPAESHNLVKESKYASEVAEFRRLMAEHLTERGEKWVKNGELQVVGSVPVLTPNYPKRAQ